MDNTYNPHGDSLGHGRWETFVKDKLFQRRSTSFTYNGCQISFSTSGGLLAENYQDTSGVTLNVGDIDPRSIRTKTYASQTAGNSCDLFPDAGMVCDIAEMTFETRNQALLIDTEHHFVYPQLQGKDHETNSRNKSHEGGIALDDVKYAGRFEKAFRHAVVLCGGRPSTF
jgi:hypothetical protein